MEMKGWMLRTATHQHGLNYAQSQSHLITDLFNVEGRAGIIRAVAKAGLIIDPTQRVIFYEAIIAWNGSNCNRAKAEKLLSDHFYFIGVLTSSRTVKLIKAQNLTIANYAQLLTSLLIKKITLSIKPPSEPLAPTELSPATESMLEHVLSAHAPTAANSLLQAI
jgi:hypothetical protein